MVLEALAFFGACTVGCLVLFITALLGHIHDGRVLGFLGAIGALLGAYMLTRVIRTVLS